MIRGIWLHEHGLRILERVASMLRELAVVTPPNAGDGLAELPKLLRLSRTWLSMSLAEQRDTHELFTRSAGELLDTWFESDALQGAYGFDAVVGNHAGPYAAGSAYVLLNRCWGEVNGRRGLWGHPAGGMGSITQAMAREAARRGVEIRCEAQVRRILVRPDVLRPAATRPCRLPRTAARAVSVRRRVASGWRRDWVARTQRRARAGAGSGAPCCMATRPVPQADLCFRLTGISATISPL